MDYLCQVCDREIIANESEYKIYIATPRKKMIKIFIKNMFLILLI